MKTKEELNAIKEEVEAVRNRLNALTDDELEQVAGGVGTDREDIQKEIDPSIPQIDDNVVL